MKRSFSSVYVGLIALVAMLVFSLTAWNQSATHQRPSVQDTTPTPRKGGHPIKDIEDAMQEVDKAMRQLDEQLKKPLPPVPAIDAKKLQAELEQSLKEIDPDKMKADIEKAMKEIDAAKLKVEMDAAMAKVDMEKVKKEMEKMKEIDFAKIEKELKDIQPKIEESMKKAKADLEKAQQDLKEHKGFIDGLDKDGLINKDENYTIEHDNGVLKINGKEQPASVYDKYRNFLKKRKSFTIKKDGEGFNIEND